ncbi:MAG: DUF533 domain-containing protein [Mailhella sp.]|nr:DUF533 domain-containing protein [Mailhella sp.]
MANTLFGILGDMLQPGQGQRTQPGRAGGQDMLSQMMGMMSGPQGQSLGAGAMGSIIGSLLSGGNAKNAAASGGAAMLAGLALNLFKNWSQAQSAQAPASAPKQQPAAESGAWGAGSQTPYRKAAAAPAENSAAMVLLEALTNAAKADGQIDDSERFAIEMLMQQFYPETDVTAGVAALIRKPIDPVSLARRIPGAQQRIDIYRLSSLAIVVDTAPERAYLNDLAKAFGIDSRTQAMLDAEAAKLRATESV